MLKIVLFVLLAVSLTPLFAFAEPSIQLDSNQNNIDALDSVLVYGKVTDVQSFIPVKLTVTAPDGEVVYSPTVSFDDDGIFKRLIHPTIPSFKEGTYTVVATHEQVSGSAKIQFTVSGDNTLGGIMNTKPSQENKVGSDLYIVSNAMAGDTEIHIKGKTIWTGRDVSLTLYSPSGNLITVAQVTPNTNGDFSTKVKIGGPLWKEDGAYTVTALQGDASELKASVQVEVINGVVVPEFGAIAVVILAIAVISIVGMTARSRLSIARI